MVQSSPVAVVFALAAAVGDFAALLLSRLRKVWFKLPQKWRKRGQESKRGAEEEDVRTWLCPFHIETGCMARLQEVRHFNETISLERAGFDHNDHTASRRCASVKI